MPDKTSSQDPSGNADTQPPPSRVGPTTIEQSEVGYSSKNNSDESTERTKKLAAELHWLEKISIGGQIVLAIVGIWALCIYSGQLRALRDQIRQESDHFVVTERAGIFVLGTGSAVTPEGFATGRITFQNTGHTVASNIFVNSCVEIRNKEPSSVKEKSGTCYDAAPFGLAGPSSTFAITRGDPKRHIDPGDYLHGVVHLYIWGTVTYVDVFGTQRFTEFCFANSTAQMGPCKLWVTAK